MKARAAAVASAIWFIAGGARAGAPSDAAPSEYRLLADANAGTRAGVVDATTAARLLLRGVDEVLVRVEPKSPSVLAAAVRFAGLALLDLPVASYEIALPHEVFGHGVRLREFGTTPTFHIDPPLPYDVTPDYRTNLGHVARPLFLDEESLVYLAGLEVETVQQQHLAAEAFRAGVLRRGEAVLYVANEVTHGLQLLTGSDLRRTADLEPTRNRGAPGDYAHLVRGALVAEALDPLFWWSLHATFVEYLYRGRRAVAFPEVHLGAVGLFATSRVRPVPWGFEHHLDVLVDVAGTRGDVTLRSGGGPGGGSVGLDVAVFSVPLGHTLAADLEVSTWWQPGLESLAEARSAVMTPVGVELDPPRVQAPAHVLGASAHVTLETRHPAWFFGTRIGAKSAGLAPGMPLAPGADVALTGGAVF